VGNPVFLIGMQFLHVAYDAIAAGSEEFTPAEFSVSFGHLTRQVFHVRALELLALHGNEGLLKHVDHTVIKLLP
jgi:hypothetical protein